MPNTPFNPRPMRISFTFDPTVVMYLVIPDVHKFKDVLRTRPTEKFGSVRLAVFYPKQPF